MPLASLFVNGPTAMKPSALIFPAQSTLEDGGSFSWSMQFAMSYEEFSYSQRTEQPMKDPLVMSFNGHPVELSGQSSAFNLS